MRSLIAVFAIMAILSSCGYREDRYKRVYEKDTVTETTAQPKVSYPACPACPECARCPEPVKEQSLCFPTCNDNLQCMANRGFTSISEKIVDQFGREYDCYE